MRITDYCFLPLNLATATPHNTAKNAPAHMPVTVPVSGFSVFAAPFELLTDETFAVDVSDFETSDCAFELLSDDSADDDSDDDASLESLDESVLSRRTYLYLFSSMLFPKA
jgi:hypothetical protein